MHELNSPFYLTGGTAASTGYLNHRFSDDLDFFVNDDNNFFLWANRVITALNSISYWEIRVTLREQRFCRLFIVAGDINLKIEMINDVPAHVGDISLHEILGNIDSPQNILANKISAAIDRNEPKDLADIWGFCIKMKLSLVTALNDAGSKAAGIFPADLARTVSVSFATVAARTKSTLPCKIGIGSKGKTTGTPALWGD